MKSRFLYTIHGMRESKRGNGENTDQKSRDFIAGKRVIDSLMSAHKNINLIIHEKTESGVKNKRIYTMRNKIYLSG